jgi:hypothetical protein
MSYCECLEVRKHFFFVNKKEAKKTLFTLDRAGLTARGPVSQKFFASPGGEPFFQKRSACLPFPFRPGGLR